MYRYIPNTREDQEKMLSAIGAGSVAELFSDIPEDIRLDRDLDLPDAMHEQELVSHMKAIASENVNTADHPCFLGAGVYDHFIPSVVGHVISRSEFYTAYTPYQPEVSQGTLQAIFEYQTMICELTGADVANASLYDGATALAEAAIIALNTTRNSKILLAGTMHPWYRKVLDTYMADLDAQVAEIPAVDGRLDLDALAGMVDKDTAAILVQSPNFFGIIEDLPGIGKMLEGHKGLFVVCTDPISLGILEAPARLGADIVVGEGQSLGLAQSFGGPLLGFMGVTEKLTRRIPGRVVGETRDTQGRRGFVLTLQTREQ